MSFIFLFLAGVTSGWCIMSLQQNANKAAAWFFISTVFFAIGAISSY